MNNNHNVPTHACTYARTHARTHDLTFARTHTYTHTDTDRHHDHCDDIDNELYVNKIRKIIEIQVTW